MRTGSQRHTNRQRDRRRGDAAMRCRWMRSNGEAAGLQQDVLEEGRSSNSRWMGRPTLDPLSAPVSYVLREAR